MSIITLTSDYGIKDFRIRAEELSNIYGERFYPPKLLDKMIAKGETFK